MSIQSLDHVINHALAELLRHCAENSQTALFVLVGGSAAEGFAVCTSDIDLVLVHADERPIRTRQFVVDNRRVEVSVYSREEFRAVVSLTRQGCTGPTFFRQLDSRRRLLFSKPIFGAERYRAEMEGARRQDFMDDLVAFQRTALLKSFSDLGGSLREALHEDDLRIRARGYLECSVDALLTSIGDYYFRDKWRVARVRRGMVGTILGPMREPVSSLLSGRPLPGAEYLDTFLEQVFAYSAMCQYLAAFSAFSFEHLLADDIEECMTRCSALRTPLLVVGQGADVLVRSSTSTLQLAPALASALCLSALGLNNARIGELAGKMASGEPGGEHVEAILMNLSAVLAKLGIG
ncbi:hypothetical protein WJ58_16320 [Burkholderia ubonensis]|uniref:nucleotidyltransferase domain-containing protein n=1 Tax=Burkholderia ubonensis TaxID=101571 RepID=UPI00075258C1|nr:nucleotidyltransferase domain-containing protein [Burkholderia ubonensis]KVM54657.1 hypothetical protein WJ58_16320 [Burkholderia ubonensis]